MLTNVKIEWQGETWGLSKREVNNAQKAAMAEAGWHYHLNIKPRHFRPEGQHLYGYQRRANATNRAKIRKGRPPLALVNTGESRNRELTVPRIKATFKQMQVKTVVKTWNLRRNERAPNMFEELTRRTSLEERDLVNVFADAMRKELARVDKSKRSQEL